MLASLNSDVIYKKTFNIFYKILKLNKNPQGQ